jgi:hypothetical protein
MVLTMGRGWIGGALVAAIAASLACGGPKKKPVTKDDFKIVSDTVNKKLNGASHSPDERKAYVIGQLGAPHRTDGDRQLWYTIKGDCNYLEMGEDGWVSWGTGARDADCDKWGVKP